MIYTSIIIDDEPKAIDLLNSYCNRTPNIKNIKSFRNPLEAINFFQNNKINVVFLDINMPNLMGTQLAKLIPQNVDIIFTTAYSEYAVESYELNAIDYLLKPISYSRFLKAIEKLFLKYKKDKFIAVKKIVIKTGYSKVHIPINEILFLKKEGNYIVYYLETQKVLARETIEQALNKLPETFIQTHRSYIVNIEKVDKITNTNLKIGSYIVSISKSRKKGTLEVFKKG